MAGFVDRLRDLGYVEGQTIDIEWRFTPAASSRFDELAVELVKRPVDVLVVFASTPGALAARRATSTIPIVAAGVIDPVRSELVDSLARPGGNVTALTATVPGSYKAAEFLLEIVPGIARAAVFVNITTPVYEFTWNTLRTVAERLGLQLQRIDVQSAQDVDTAFQEAARRRVDAVFALQNPLWLAARARVGALAEQYRLPTAFEERAYVEAGVLMSYGADYVELNRRAAVFVDKILKGTKVSDLPVEQPSVFDFFINATTLRALGLTVPPSISPLVTEWIN